MWESDGSWLFHNLHASPGRRSSGIHGPSLSDRLGAAFLGEIVSNKTTAERFWQKVNKNGPIHPTLGRCWVWKAHTKSGYGRFHNGCTDEPSHRFSYRLHGGVIPPKYVIDHLCRRPSCVNPNHLQACTNEQNVQRGLVMPRNRPAGYVWGGPNGKKGGKWYQKSVRRTREINRELA